MNDLLAAFGLMLVLEGLLLAVYPRIVHDVAKLAKELSLMQWRQIGFFAALAGAVCVGFAQRYLS